MKNQLTVFALALFSASAWIAYAVQPKAPPAEQIQFSAEEDRVKRPVPVPKEVWTILKQDKGSPDACGVPQAIADTSLAKCSSASLIHLGSANEADLIVEGEGPLRGANLNTFWVFLQTPTGWKLALTVPAHDLIVKPPRVNGYRVIETSEATSGRMSSITFRFEAGKYEKFRELSH